VGAEAGGAAAFPPRYTYAQPKHHSSECEKAGDSDDSKRLAGDMVESRRDCDAADPNNLHG
jgi:hypothetical protein